MTFDLKKAAKYPIENTYCSTLFYLKKNAYIIIHIKNSNEASYEMCYAVFDSAVAQ